MSTISASTTTTTAYVVTADTTGALVLQTGATPTTALTIDTSQNVTLAGTLSTTGITNTGVATATRFNPTGSSVTGNGMYLPAANSLGLSTNGTNAVYIDSSQNVGIGTASPVASTKLTINGSNDQIYLRTADTNAVVMSIGNAAGNSVYFQSKATGTGTALPFAWYMGGTQAMTLDASGRLSIANVSAYPAMISTESTGDYGAGNVSAIFASTSNRATVRLRSTGNNAAELFFDVNGAVRWDISARDSSLSYQLNWYPQGATPSYTSVNAAVMTLTQAGALSAVSKSFKIDHPLPSMTDSHNLVHMSVESPQADLIYRGVAILVDGKAIINIDQNSKMTDGTFVLLCREVQCFTTNETDWTPVRGSVTGNILTIESQDPVATSTISWMVIGERKDTQMMNLEVTDDNGKLIVEPTKTIEKTAGA